MANTKRRLCSCLYCDPTSGGEGKAYGVRSADARRDGLAIAGANVERRSGVALRTQGECPAKVTKVRGEGKENPSAMRMPGIPLK